MSVAESPGRTSSVPATGHVPGETCPRCHTTQPWGESSWCPNCAYYPVVDGATGGSSSWADALPEPDAPEEEFDDRGALQSIPLWFWGMLGGVVAITAFSVAVRLMLPDEDSPRGLIALIQLSIGLISMLTAHIVASKNALQNDRRLNLNDVALAWFNIWQPTIAKLPETCRRVQAMAWGGFAVLTAVTVIGGIDYSAPFRTHKAPEVKPMKMIGAVAAAARAQAAEETPEAMQEALGDLQSEVAAMQEEAGLNDGQGGPKNMEEALNELGNMQEQLEQLEGIDPEAVLAEELASTMSCYIYGVVTDKNNTPKAFLFAANTKGQDQHVATIKTEDLPREDFRIIAVRLYTAVQKQPEIETDQEAVWVKPIVSCRLAYRGLKENGELNDPEFEAIVVKQRGRMDAERRTSASR